MIRLTCPCGHSAFRHGDSSRTGKLAARLFGPRTHVP